MGNDGEPVFLSVDPISEKFPALSTYNYASNSPIANVDLHGLQAVPAIALWNYFKTTDTYKTVTAPQYNYDAAQQQYNSENSHVAGLGNVAGNFGNANTTEALGGFAENAAVAMDIAAGGQTKLPKAKQFSFTSPRLGNGKSITAFRGNMCGPCAIVEDARLGGDFSLTEADVLSELGKSADNFTGLKKDDIEKFVGGSFEFIGGRKSLDSILKSRGSGTRGIVYGSNSDYTILHAFNVQVDANGIVKYTDGANDIGHTLQTFMNNLSFLQTN